MNLTFLGSGSFGTALAVLFSNYNFKVKMFDRNSCIIEGINNQRRNIKYLTSIHIPQEVFATEDIEEAVKDSNFIFFTLPSGAIREVASKLRGVVGNNSVLVCLSKGIEQNTYKRLSEVLKEELPQNPIVVLSGPSHAEEVALNKPTSLVATSTNMHYAELVRDTLTNNFLRIYTNEDIVGIEIGSSMKNIIALLSGIILGMDYGDNLVAEIITRALHDIIRMGVKLGGKMETFLGLTGIGDIIVTCLSSHSRNRRCGLLIGQGMSLNEAIEKIGMVVEGVSACKTFYEISKEKNIKVPIIEILYDILFNNVDLNSIKDRLLSINEKNEEIKF